MHPGETISLSVLCFYAGAANNHDYECFRLYAFLASATTDFPLSGKFYFRDSPLALQNSASLDTSNIATRVAGKRLSARPSRFHDEFSHKKARLEEAHCRSGGRRTASLRLRAWLS